MVTVPVRVPMPDGVNVTLTTQLLPAVNVLPQLLVWLNSALATMEVIFSVALPVLYSVKFEGGLVEPIAYAAKLMFAVERPTIGLAAKPLPVSDTDCGLSAALSVTCNVAGRAPVCMGVKLMPI